MYPAFFCPEILLVYYTLKLLTDSFFIRQSTTVDVNYLFIKTRLFTPDYQNVLATETFHQRNTKRIRTAYETIPPTTHCNAISSEISALQTKLKLNLNPSQ